MLTQVETQTISVHADSQSNQVPNNGYNRDIPLNMDGEKGEQNFASRGLNKSLHDLFVRDIQSLAIIDFDVPEDYLDYLARDLNMPNVVNHLVRVDNENGNLSKNILNDTNIATTLAQRTNGQKLKLATFTPTQNEQAVLSLLQENGLNIIGEFSRQTIGLANKGAQHLFLHEVELAEGSKVQTRHNSELLHIDKFTDKRGEMFSFEVFKRYLKMKYHDSKLFFKHAFGTAGAGMWDETHLKEVYEQIKNENLIVLEQKFENATEHALHFYIDPETGEIEIFGVYDQEVESNGTGGFSHVGCTYPSQNESAKQKLLEIAPLLGTKLRNTGATGYMCCDVLVNDKSDIHIMEVNTRPGANLYALMLAQAVMKQKFGIEDRSQLKFALRAGMHFDKTTLSEMLAIPQVAQLASSGQVVFSNCAKFADDHWDLIFLEVPGGNSIEKNIEVVKALAKQNEP